MRREETDGHEPASRGRSRGQHRRKQEGLDLVGDAEEADTSVGVRPDRGKRVRLRERCEHDEEPSEEERNGRGEERFPPARHEGKRSASRRDGEADRERRTDIGGGQQQRDRDRGRGARGARRGRAGASVSRTRRR